MPFHSDLFLLIRDHRVLGKHKWQPIEYGMIDWRPGMVQNDPAGDLANVTLTLPTPPPSVYAQQQRHAYPGRAIKPFPSHYDRGRTATTVTRTVSIAMASPEGQYTPHTAASMVPNGYMYPHHQEVPPPMYGEDEVPMSVQMPAAGPSTGSTVEVPGSATLAPAPQTWEGIVGLGDNKGVKRSRSDGSDAEDDVDDDKSGDDLGFGEQSESLWHE